MNVLHLLVVCVVTTVLCCRCHGGGSERGLGREGRGRRGGGPSARTVICVLVFYIIISLVLSRRSKEYDVEGPRAQAASPNSTATRTIQSSNPTLFGRLNPNSSDGQRLQVSPN